MAVSAPGTTAIGRVPDAAAVTIPTGALTPRRAVDRLSLTERYGVCRWPHRGRRRADDNSHREGALPKWHIFSLSASV